MKKQKSPTVGYILAFFLGILGIHLFYYRKYIRGALYLLFSWTYVPMVLGWIDMFFINRWTNELNNNVIGQRSKTSPKNPVDVNEKNLVTQRPEAEDIASFKNQGDTETIEMPTEKPNSLSMIKDVFTFYSEKDIVLPKYIHLDTPIDIKASIDELKKPKNNRYEKSGIVFEVSISSSHQSFIRDSLKHSQTRGIETKEVPFQSYWPTFEQLDKKQRKWYFYWREQALKGNYLDVDLSYIFIFVYELINYSFNINAAFNVSMLVRLNEAYIERHPKLKKYLNRWIADMLFEIDERELANEFVEESYNTSIPRLYNLIQENQDSLESISITYWKPYIKNYRETEFFSKNKNKIYKRFKESIPSLKKLYEKEGKSLLAEWFEIKNEREVRYLYSGAVLGREYHNTHVHVEKVYATEDLTKVISNLFRLAENVVRSENNEKRNIKVDESMLSEDMKEVMVKSRFKTVKKSDKSIKGSKIPVPPKEEQTAEKEVKRSEIQFDWDEISQKDKELNRIKDKIEEKEANDQIIGEDISVSPISGAEDDQNKKIADASNAQSPKVDNQQEKKKSFSADLIEVGEDYDGLVEALSSSQQEFLSLIKDGEIRKAKASEFAKQDGKMLGVFLSEINEIAMEHIDDTLLEEEDDKVIIIEDYEEVIDMVRSVLIEN